MKATPLADTAETRAALADALRFANIPVLLLILHQLTGDDVWLGERYRPTRPKGLDDHPSGDLPEPVQDEVRAAAADAVTAWWSGRAMARPTLSTQELSAVLSFSAGETVPPEYGPMVAEDLGFAPAPVPHRPAAGDVGDPHVVIIGAGVSGLVLSRDLDLAGIPHVVLEKRDRVGGTWTANPYPGCGVDTPSYLYSFSFYYRDWSQHYAKRPELETYFADLARDLDLLRHVRFGHEAHEAEWDEADRRWTIRLRTPEGEDVELRAPILVSAVGQLSEPKLPAVEGLDRFAGTVFHSSTWPSGLDLTGKRVAVIGTGASAMQIVPAVVDDVGELTVFQRSPQWVAPCALYFEPIEAGFHFLMAHVPLYYEWYRVRLGWIINDKVHPSLQVDPEWPLRPASINRINEGHRRVFDRYLRDQLEGRPDLVERCLPDYPPFGKRMLLDNGWFAALRRPHVRLVADGVARLDGDQVVSSTGESVTADVVVLATGFQAQRPTFPLVIRGADGRTLRDAWNDDDGRAYLGMTTPGFPNLFVLYGPNSSLGHGGSYIFVAERSARYIAELLVRMIERDVPSVEVRAEVWRDYVDAVDAAHDRMIWSQPGFSTWYTNSRGRVTANMPWRVVDFWGMTREALLDDYVCATRVLDERR
jgi:4-hydroxyacetophenone monooxygenase